LNARALLRLINFFLCTCKYYIYIYIECGCNTIANSSGCNRNPSFALRSTLFFRTYLVSTARNAKIAKGTGSCRLTRFLFGKPSLSYATETRSAFLCFTAKTISFTDAPAKTISFAGAHGVSDHPSTGSKKSVSLLFYFFRNGISSIGSNARTAPFSLFSLAGYKYPIRHY
jgi:hypothetical protein